MAEKINSMEESREECPLNEQKKSAETLENQSSSESDVTTAITSRIDEDAHSGLDNDVGTCESPNEVPVKMSSPLNEQISSETKNVSDKEDPKLSLSCGALPSEKTEQDHLPKRMVQSWHEQTANELEKAGVAERNEAAEELLLRLSLIHENEQTTEPGRNEKKVTQSKPSPFLPPSREADERQLVKEEKSEEK